jgi:hypothetical protein
MNKKLIPLFLLASGFLASPAYAENSLPDLNRKVIEYVESVIGEQVDRGECWDLAFQALNRIDARWDGKYKYGKEINPRKGEIFPGDIIQFKDVKVRYREGNTIYTNPLKRITILPASKQQKTR